MVDNDDDDGDAILFGLIVQYVYPKCKFVYMIFDFLITLAINNNNSGNCKLLQPGTHGE